MGVIPLRTRLRACTYPTVTHRKKSRNRASTNAHLTIYAVCPRQQSTPSLVSESALLTGEYHHPNCLLASGSVGSNTITSSLFIIPIAPKCPHTPKQGKRQQG